MNILVSGSTGLLGSALLPALNATGHQVTRLVRSDAGASGPVVLWDPQAGFLETKGLEGLDAVVHLAGENIAAGRWTAAQKARIRESRVKGTHLLSTALSQMHSPPKVFACASAIGFYGNRGEEILREESTCGPGFLAEVCRDWEEAASIAARKGIRVVHFRFGVILSPKGGALAKMLLPFRLGLGGVVGSGKQYMSWISLEDAARAALHALNTPTLQGPLNLVAPNPVRNREFTKSLGRALSRPTLFPMPAFAARLAFGEMADDLLLASARVVPAKLESSGFSFLFPELAGALRHLLQK